MIALIALRAIILASLVIYLLRYNICVNLIIRFSIYYVKFAQHCVNVIYVDIVINFTNATRLLR